MNEKPTQLQIALAAADAGKAGHWPTVAGVLADECRSSQIKIEALREEWRKYRLALNRIAHPDSYGINPGHEKEIARRALVIGVEVDPLPDGAEK